MFSANQITGFLIQLFLKNKSMKQPHFLHVDTNSQKLKLLRKFFCFGVVKIECGQSGHGTLKLAVSQE